MASELEQEFDPLKRAPSSLFRLREQVENPPANDRTMSTKIRDDADRGLNALLLAALFDRP